MIISEQNIRSHYKHYRSGWIPIGNLTMEFLFDVLFQNFQITTIKTIPTEKYYK